jgi:hypothetical protein
MIRIILWIDSDSGSAVDTNPFYSHLDTSKYSTYGIRNSFGITLDLITGTLWQTENAPSEYDENNIVKPGFNSGWIQLMGPMSLKEKIVYNLQILLNSLYSDPQLVVMIQ